MMCVSGPRAVLYLPTLEHTNSVLPIVAEREQPLTGRRTTLVRHVITPLARICRLEKLYEITACHMLVKYF